MDLTNSRPISRASQIPLIRSSLPQGRIGLIGTRGMESSPIPDAIKYKDGWAIGRVEPFPFEEERFLPRFARREVTPEIVDLIPASSWFASLANLLVGSSWKSLRSPFLIAAGSCEECGDPASLEGHEAWNYDARTGIQSLGTIRSLCARCHATQHLGRANIVGNFPGVFDRLCKLNRVDLRERETFRQMIFDKFEQRSNRDWAIDVSMAFRIVPQLALKADVQFGGDGWVWRRGANGGPDIEAKIVGAEIGWDGKRLHLVPSGTQLEQVA